MIRRCSKQALSANLASIFLSDYPVIKRCNLATAGNLSSRLNTGITELDDEILAQSEALIPDGEYDVLLTRFKPSLCQPGDPDDYFSKQLPDQFRTNVYDPQTAYYLVRKTIQIDPQYGWPDQLMELLVPLQQQSQLNPERVTYYRSQYANGVQPTCLAFGLLENEIPTNRYRFFFITISYALYVRRTS